MAARIEGGYSNFCSMMLQKHQEVGTKLEGNVLVLDSYDGAEHKQTKNGCTSIISFSLQIVSTQTAPSASSNNILTWQQMVATEKAATIFPAINNIFFSKLQI